MRFLREYWQKLFDPNQRAVAYLARAFAADMPITLLIAAVVTWTIPDAAPRDIFKGDPLLMLLGFCLIAPFLETLMMRAVFAALRKFTQERYWLIFNSAIIWSILHSMSALGWGLGVLWPFVIFSVCYLTHEEKGKQRAFWMTTALHGLHNSVPALAYLAVS